MTVTLHLGDCRNVLPTLPDNSVDSIVTDPPYELGFMNKRWDSTGIAYDVNVWRECLRVLKPGGHLLAFGGTRTYHRLVCAIEDAGFEIRDTIAWVYATGFPKSLDVSKAIAKAAGAERRVVGIAGRRGANRNCMSGDFTGGEYTATAPATPDAETWQGWGTALKPAHEPLVLARKPLAERTVAANVLAWGCGALNVGGCRVGTESVQINTWDDGAKPFGGGAGHNYTGRESLGRFPANLIHDGSDEVVALFPNTTSRSSNAPQPIKTSKGIKGGAFGNDAARKPEGHPTHPEYVRGGFDDSGSAARFFYCAKASKADRDEGLEGFERKPNDWYRESSGLNKGPNERVGGTTERVMPRNFHPCVKPTALMRYLCRLVTPPGGVVLDPFTGSGSTGKAAVLEGFGFVGIEKEAEYLAIAERRIEHARMQPSLLAEAAE